MLPVRPAAALEIGACPWTNSSSLVALCSWTAYLSGGKVSRRVETGGLGKAIDESPQLDYLRVRLTRVVWHHQVAHVGGPADPD